MAAYAQRPVPLRLLDLEDVWRYCCIVAGLVGELLTALWGLGAGTAPRMLFAYHFGQFLQKVNILKDQAEDEAAGRFLVPDRRELLGSLRADADGARPLSDLAAGQRAGYRIFCAWSLMLGRLRIAQLNGPRESHARRRWPCSGASPTSPRMTRRCGASSRSCCPRSPSCTPGPRCEARDHEWFLRMLDAPLSAEELARLGSVRAAPSRQVAAKSIGVSNFHVHLESLAAGGYVDAADHVGMHPGPKPDSSCDTRMRKDLIQRAVHLADGDEGSIRQSAVTP